MGYNAVYDAWKADPEGFWMAQAEAIDWDKKPSQALFDRGDHMYEWFADGMVAGCDAGAARCRTCRPTRRCRDRDPPDPRPGDA